MASFLSFGSLRLTGTPYPPQRSVLRGRLAGLEKMVRGYEQELMTPMFRDVDAQCADEIIRVEVRV